MPLGSSVSLVPILNFFNNGSFLGHSMTLKSFRLCNGWRVCWSVITGPSKTFWGSSVLPERNP